MSDQIQHPMTKREAVLLYALTSDFEKAAGLDKIHLAFEKFLADNDIDLKLAKKTVEYRVLNNGIAIFTTDENVMTQLGV
jgi:hypothetical protein